MSLILKQASQISIFSVLLFTSANVYSQAIKEITQASSDNVVEVKGKPGNANFGIQQHGIAPRCDNLGKHYSRTDKTAWNESLWDWCAEQGYKYALPTFHGTTGDGCIIREGSNKLKNCRSTATRPGSNNSNGYYLNYQGANPVYCCK